MGEYFCNICSGRTAYPQEMNQKQLISDFTRKSTNITTHYSQFKAKLNSIASITSDSMVKSQIQKLAKQVDSSDADIARLQQIFNSIIQKNDTQMQEANKQISALKDQSEKQKEEVIKIKKMASEKHDISKKYQKTTIQLAECNLALKNKNNECKELKEKLDKLKKKAKRLLSENNPKSVQKEENNEDNEEVIKYLNEQINSLKNKVNQVSNGKEESEKTIDDLTNELKEKDAEIESLREEFEKVEKCQTKKAKFIFQEQEFELNNPFKGELGEKFDKFKNMTHFEPYQRAQLIINEASREIAIYEKTNKTLRESIESLQESTRKETKDHEDTRNSLFLLLNQLQKLESNEEILSSNGILKDQDFVKFVEENIKTEIPMADVDGMISKLSATDTLACSLVSSLLLANAKQQEQQKRLIYSLSQKDAILENIKAAGMLPEKIVDDVVELKRKKNQYKKELVQNNAELEEVKRYLENCENENLQIKQDLQNHQEDLSRSIGDLTETTTENAKLEERIKCMENKISQLQNEKSKMEEDYKALSNEKKEVEEELKKSQNEIANKREEYAKLDVMFRMAKQNVKEKYLEDEDKSRCRERNQRKKMQQIQSKHAQEILDVEARAKLLKETSFRALDAQISQTSDLKGLMKDLLLKLETVKHDKMQLKAENETLKKQVSSLNKRLSSERIKSAKESETYNYNMQNKRLNDQTNRVISNKELAASALREKQRIMNIVARELGAPYNIEFFEGDEEDSFVLFIRKVRDDLKKLKLFQNSQLDN